MSLADEIRNSFNLPASYFEENIIPYLKRGGRIGIICDTHIAEISNHAIPFKYGNSLEKWADENGFYVTHQYNSYGVRHIVITI